MGSSAPIKGGVSSGYFTKVGLRRGSVISTKLVCDVDTNDIEARFHMYRKYLIALRSVPGQYTSFQTRTTEEYYTAMGATALWCFQ